MATKPRGGGSSAGGRGRGSGGGRSGDNSTRRQPPRSRATRASCGPWAPPTTRSAAFAPRARARGARAVPRRSCCSSTLRSPTAAGECAFWRSTRSMLLASSAFWRVALVEAPQFIVRAKGQPGVLGLEGFCAYRQVEAHRSVALDQLLQVVHAERGSFPERGGPAAPFPVVAICSGSPSESRSSATSLPRARPHPRLRPRPRPPAPIQLERPTAGSRDPALGRL